MKFISEKVVPIAVLLIFIGLFGMIFWVVKVYQDRQNAFHVKEPLPVNNNREFKRGEEIMVVVDYCLNTDEPVTIKRSIDVTPIDLTPTPVSFTQGCRVAIIPFKIPLNFIPGEYDASLYVTIPTINFGDIYPTTRFKVIE